ncbi:hypothetical protein [Asticcacaulis excentricus]|uniref:Uncharacterized protein n=1 Tax=Asticcacaulis excentricus (strain ATCC 15261 / DSM 4724 / KCTC 12464 / NCIMB 9791 / VKM B-1370 / CB 48) TaxID=573065 RepID=E8RVW4_ASTEC|nr:hypothetical protein [Asticcacaulis excentricus]ADU15386.1 hypothetical protein Astex_3776 [Asticcacaulis excentricus CB 48]
MSNSKISSLDFTEFTNPAPKPATAGEGTLPAPRSKEEERAILQAHSAFPSREVKVAARKVNMNLYLDPDFAELVKSTSKMHRYSYGELFEMALKHLLDTKGIK